MVSNMLNDLAEAMKALDGKKKTPLPPESWVDELADKVEIQRLCAMQVLIPAKQFQGEVTGSLTTKFVRDWRLKQWGEVWKIQRKGGCADRAS